MNATDLLNYQIEWDISAKGLHEELPLPYSLEDTVSMLNAEIDLRLEHLHSGIVLKDAYFSEKGYKLRAEGVKVFFNKTEKSRELRAMRRLKRLNNPSYAFNQERAVTPILPADIPSIDFDKYPSEDLDAEVHNIALDIQLIMSIRHRIPFSLKALDKGFNFDQKLDKCLAQLGLGTSAKRIAWLRVTGYSEAKACIQLLELYLNGNRVRHLFTPLRFNRKSTATIHEFIPPVIGESYWENKWRMDNDAQDAYYAAKNIFHDMTAQGRQSMGLIRDGWLAAKELFGFDRGFTIEELKQRYRELSLTMHPDKGGSSDGFIELRAAYDLLKEGPPRTICRFV